MAVVDKTLEAEGRFVAGSAFSIPMSLLLFSLVTIEWIESENLDRTILYGLPFPWLQSGANSLSWSLAWPHACVDFLVYLAVVHLVVRFALTRFRPIGKVARVAALVIVWSSA